MPALAKIKPQTVPRCKTPLTQDGVNEDRPATQCKPKEKNQELPGPVEDEKPRLDPEFEKEFDGNLKNVSWGYLGLFDNTLDF